MTRIWRTLFILSSLSLLGGCPAPGASPLAPALIILNQLADPPALVSAEKVTVPGPGWLAVYEDSDGELGAILGYTAVGKGVRDNVPVELSRPVVHHETLHVRLLQDLGQLGVYEDAIDTPYLVNNTAIGGNITVTLPLIAASPSLRVFDQVCDPENAVVIDSALSLGRGWAVVYDDNGGNANAVLGAAALADGPNKNITVILQRDVMYDEPLHAILHLDLGAIGVWEPELDLPAEDGEGELIAESFSGTLPITIPNIDLQLTSVASEAANVVTVFDVVSDGRGIVVIRAGGSATGAVIGWTAVNGNDGDTDVALDRAIIHRETLWAGLYVDNDVTEEWEEATDGPVQVDPLTGEEQSGTFEVRHEPAITVEDQTAAPPNTVVVASAHSTLGGFVAVYGDGGATWLGAAALVSGHNDAVSVTLNRDVVNGESLLARLHEDTNGDDALDVAIDEVEGQDAPFVAYLTFSPSLTVSDSDATGLTSRVTITSATSDGPGWLVVMEDDSGAPGSVIGMAPLAAGAHDQVQVTADRRLVDQEMIHVALHDDESPVGTWDSATDLPQQLDGVDVTGSFIVTVPAGLPDGRLVFANEGNSAYNVSGQEPAWLGAIGGGDTNQALTLKAGWRYEVFNEAASAHPLAFRDGADAPLLTQDGDGALESDADVDFLEDGATMTFTVAAALASDVDNYVCTLHPAMSASVTVQ